MLAFLNLEERECDADGQSLEQYKRDTEEMIVELDDKTQQAIGHTTSGIFRFENLKPEEISPYVSLQELFRVRFKDGRYGVGN